MNENQTLEHDGIRAAVREAYGSIAVTNGSCCGPAACGTTDYTERLGYDWSETESVPDGANLGLGCGNPGAIAALKAGETVLDLGSGAGFDCFLASKAVGAAGKVIGVDMTAEMVSKARKNAASGGFANVEFRLGEIENLPVADSSVDVIISNCVINLSPNKRRVFAEAHRVLKPGGRLAIADIVALHPLPAELKNDLQLYSGCMAGASPIEELESILADLGFSRIKISNKNGGAELIQEWAPGRRIEEYVTSATIEAVKP